MRLGPELWPGYSRRRIVRQNDEKVPVAGIVIIATGATAEQQHGFRLHQSNNGRYRRMRTRIQARHDPVD